MNRAIHAAIIALAASLAVPALGQQRRTDDGRARDASNRVGSQGYNDAPANPRVPDPRVSGNQIVTGNVTGGRQFRDNVGYTDPGAFRGPTAGRISDRFVRDSAGVP